MDNLKLGYGGTQEEMKRLLADAQAISGVEYDISSYADVVEAIHVVQVEMGIAGTTAKEAGETISGSLGAMKSAWQNLVVGIASGDADLEGMIGNLVSSATTFAGNIMPVIETALSGIGQLVAGLGPIIAEQLPAIIATTLPSLVQSGGALLSSLASGVLDQLPMLIEVAVGIITTLADDLSASLPDMVPAIVGIMTKIVMTLIDNAPELLTSAVEIIAALATGLVNSIPDLIAAIPEIVMAIVRAFADMFSNFEEIGSNIVDGIKQGIANAWDALTSWVSEKFRGLVSGVKSFLGIASPSKVFAEIGGHMADGVGVGWEKTFGGVKDQIEGSMEFDAATVGFSVADQQMQAINGLAGVMMSGNVGDAPVIINLMTPDGDKFAEWQLPSLIRVANAAGTPIVGAV